MCYMLEPGLATLPIVLTNQEAGARKSGEPKSSGQQGQPSNTHLMKSVCNRHNKLFLPNALLLHGTLKGAFTMAIMVLTLAVKGSV